MHRTSERLARISAGGGSRISHSLPVIRVFPAAPAREHSARDRNRRIRRLIQPQRVIRPVNAEGRIDHRQEHLQFQSGRHARLASWWRSAPVRYCDGFGFNTLPPAQLKPVSSWRATERCGDDLIVLRLRDLQLRTPDDRINARIDKWRQCYRARNGDAVFQIPPGA